MKRNELIALLKRNPVIAAVRSHEAAQRAARSGSSVAFLLNASILTVAEDAAALRDAGKRVFLHLDLLEGLGADAAAVQWCARTLRPDGVISTRPKLLRAAEDEGLLTVQRLFLMDSASFDRSLKLLKSNPPDMAEVLPGLVPKAISALAREIDRPIIAGGMITEPVEVRRAILAGALAVSAGEEALWNLENE